MVKSLSDTAVKKGQEMQHKIDSARHVASFIGPTPENHSTYLKGLVRGMEIGLNDIWHLQACAAEQEAKEKSTT